MADKKITRQLSIFINGKEVKNSLGGIGREIAAVKAKLKEANDPTDIKKYKAELDKLGKAYGEVKSEVHNTNTTLQDARGHWDNLMSGFLSGNIKQATSGLKGIASNIRGITKAAWAFIATPIGAAIAAVATIGLGVKKWVDYNLEIEKTNQLVRDLTQETGMAVDVIRIRAELLRDTFEVDINKSVESAKSLVKGFGISYNEAFDIIEDGAIRGKLKNDEFLDSLKEYPIQFKNAGFSAQDFANIVSTGIDLSIYSDKLPDAIKEFNLSITEQTDAAKEALTNAFGEKFTSKLLKGLKNGSVTAKDALATISAEAERIGLNSQQAQLLTADLFKGAGEDAGGALKIFEAVNLALNEQKKPLTEIQQIQKEQLDTNKELNSVYTQLFASGSKGFNVLIQKGKLFATQTLLKILKGGVDVYNWFVDLNNESGLFSALLSALGQIAVAPFKILGKLISGAWNSFKGLGNIVAGIFTFDLDKIKQGFSQGFGALNKTLEEVAKVGIDSVSKIYDAFNDKSKLKKISLDDLLADDTVAVTPNNETPVNNNKSTDQLEADKKLIEKRKELYDKAEKELNEIIKKQQEERLLNSKSAFEKEELAIDQKYEKLKEKFILSEEEKKALLPEQIKERAALIQQLEDEADREKQDLKIEREAEFREQLKEIEEENRLLDEEAKLELDLSSAASKEERELILLDRAKYIADQELKIERDKELAKVKEYENAEQLRAAIRKNYDKKQTKIDAAFETTKKESKKEEVKWVDMTEQQKFGLVKQGLGQAADAFNKGSNAWKAMKISEALMSTYEGAQSAFTSLAKIPYVGVPLGIAAAAAAVKAGLSRVSQIKNTKKEEIPKFFTGGPTGDKAMYNDEYGTVTGVVHDNEWVAPKFMTESPRYAPTIQWLETERKKELGQFFDGGNTSVENNSNSETETVEEIPVLQNNNEPLLIAVNRLNDNLEKGIKSYQVRDYESFLNQKEIDEEHEQILSNTRKQ
jgi:hypothetical protein